jgi:hypothetical protein
VSEARFETRDVSEFYAADPWLETADALLREPDPGPTPFLVDELLVAEAPAAALRSADDRGDESGLSGAETLIEIRSFRRG